MKSIVVFGGAFNPVTNAHLQVAEQIVNEYEIDMMLFLPVGNRYEKKGLLNASMRVDMLKATCINNMNFEVSTIEVTSGKRLYTIDTLNVLKKQYSGDDIYFLMGTDNLKEIHTWKGAEEILKNFKIMSISRNGDSVGEIIENDSLLSSNKDNIVEVKEKIRNDNSSTYVRELRKQGKSIRYLVPEEVRKYIEKYNLYIDDDSNE